MSVIAIVATDPSYHASMGAMIDAHARLGEAFDRNPALSDYATMQTQLRLTSAEGSDVISLVGGRTIRADVRYAELAALRIVYLPSFQLREVDRHADLHAWLRRQAEAGAHLAACGASVFHLAAAGLLAETSAAVAPRLAEQFRRRFPAVAVNDGGPIQRARRVWTCARDVDSAALVALLFAEAFSLPVARGIAAREAPGPAAAALIEQTDPVVAQAQMWIRDRFTRRFRIADLARDLGLSHQGLIRRFRDAGSPTPRDFVQRVRIEAAAIMLTETQRTVAEIAQLVGYADVPSFRRVFIELRGEGPAVFRKRRRAA